MKHQQPPLKDLIIDESRLADIPEPINTEIVLYEPAFDLKAKKKLAKAGNAAVAKIMERNKKLPLLMKLVRIVEK